MASLTFSVGTLVAILAIGASNPHSAPAAASPCSVAPLPPITDSEAQAFEKGSGPDTADLRPAMASALQKFQHLILSIGGKFELKSAYRPPAYQAHLQQVWYKWAELKNNHETGCQALRTAVAAEFEGHHLLESQKPVTSSDHTRGLAFDATVVMPLMAKLKNHFGLDRLAKMAGIMRPDIGRDPVHFKLGTGLVARLRNARHGFKAGTVLAARFKRGRHGALVAEGRAAKRGHRV